MSNDSNVKKTVRVALVQDFAPASFEEARKRFAARVADAAGQGANIICTQELFQTEYFCWKQDPDFFDLAEPIPGPGTDFYAELAKRHGVVIVGSFFEKRAPGLSHNTAVIFDSDGSIAGVYRKMHIPQDPGFEEKFYFAPGDGPFRAWDTAFGRIGVVICWDQWYPESARLTALDGASVIFCPTAIGTIESEPDDLMLKQRHAWLTVQHGHAVANGCFFAAVNRVGTEHGTRFWGSSFVSDFYGADLAIASRDKAETVYADCDLAAMEEHRRMWPFFRDRRIDAYGPILKRFGD